MSKKELTLEERFRHLSEQYTLLEGIHNDTVKQYDRLRAEYTDVLMLAKRYSEHMEYCLKVIEEENSRLKEKGGVDVKES
jgi:hypothetical protein